MRFYLTTMAWEWFPDRLCIVGVRRYGKSLVEVTGARWNSVKEVVRDIGIALAFWIEETIFRGYLQKQFIAWTGNFPVGVLLSAAIFGACHFYQGAKAALLIAMYGALFGVLAAKEQTSRNDHARAA